MCTLLLAMEKHIYELILKNYLSLLFAITEVDFVVPSAGVSGDQCLQLVAATAVAAPGVFKCIHVNTKDLGQTN